MKKDIDLIDIERYKLGDVLAFDEIYHRYKGKIRAIARRYYLIGGDIDDLSQEGLLGLLKAVGTYNPNNKLGASFSTFAHLSIESNIKSAIRKSNNNKNKPLNSYVEIDQIITDKLSIDPLADWIEEESGKEIMLKLKKLLSSFEYSVLEKFLSGYSYEDIAFDLNKKVKGVDNALQRVRAKLKLQFKENTD